MNSNPASLTATVTPSTQLDHIRRLTSLACHAAASLIPLSADGIGADSHGGRLADPAETLHRALGYLEAAGALAGRIRGKAMASGGEAGE